jgi:hypothetical protein
MTGKHFGVRVKIKELSINRMTYVALFTADI